MRIKAIVSGVLCILLITAPVSVFADNELVGPGGRVEVEEGGTVDYDTGEGHNSDHIHVDENEDSADEQSESSANGSTNQTYVDNRTQDEKDLNKKYVQLRDLVESWKGKCTGDVYKTASGNSNGNMTTIQYGQLSISDIQQAKDYLDSFKGLIRTGDVDDYWGKYYYGFDFRDPSSGFSPTANPSVSGTGSLKEKEMSEIMDQISDDNGISGISMKEEIAFKPMLPSRFDFLNPFGGTSIGGMNMNLNASAYSNGSPIRTDIVPGGLFNAPQGSWYRDIESLYRYFDLEIPESMTGAHGTFQSNAMNDFCSIALIRNYRVQDVINEIEEIGNPISDDYQIHLFSEDGNGNRREIGVLNTNQRINTIKPSDYPNDGKIIAKTYRKFNVTTYTRIAYAEYEYLIDVGTNNILWYSEHSMESERAGKTGCRTITTHVTSGISDWIADPDEAEIIIRDLSELTENDTITERID
ncbi:MAG: hypothetical protein MJ116_06370 [Lachnospiraceae bacterium]|nr:hypothetical protein [Lachnospiraceae bacterium]